MKKITVLAMLFGLLTSGVLGQAVPGKSSVAVPVGKEKTKPNYPPGFVSDGCTFFPDGKYRDCCVAHDLDYYKGEGGFKARRKADKRLYKCIRKKKKGWKYGFIATMMYLGVRMGGMPFLPTPFRWGFGKDKIKNVEKNKESRKNKGKQSTKKKDEKDSDRTVTKN